MDDPPKAEESDASATERSLSEPPPQVSADSVDGDSPAEVRVTFIVLMLAAAGLCALPRQWVSAGILLGVALVAAVVHFSRGSRR